LAAGVPLACSCCCCCQSSSEFLNLKGASVVAGLADMRACAAGVLRLGALLEAGVACCCLLTLNGLSVCWLRGVWACALAAVTGVSLTECGPLE
jgi:hypothetical protein